MSSRDAPARARKVSRRRLAAVMLTDLVGYSALVQQDERHALRILREQGEIVRPILRSFRGRIVKTLGDGFLVEFSNALDAVECAVAVQRAVDARNVRSRDARIELRIGVHLGDVVQEGGDIFGDAVNIAARLEPLGDPGGVCISQQVFDQVRNKVAIPIELTGTPRMKNISVPIPVYRVLLPFARPAPAPRSEGPRVAILPLVNLSGRAEDEYFVDGITEELIQSTSQVGGLRVIGRSSMMRYKRSDRSPVDIAKELGASAVVEGSIRTAGARVRVAIRLLDASTAETLWSQGFDREVAEVFAFQSEVSRRIAEALRVEILGPESTVLDRAPTTDADAHALYLRGRHLLNQRTEASLRQSISTLEQALQRDPRLALGYAGIADAYSTLAWLEYLRPRFAFPRARSAAEQALALNGALPEAHTSLGFVRFLYDRDWTGAETAFRTAIALNKNYPTAHQFYSDYLKAMGRLDEALEEVRRALELDPLSLGINTALGHVLYLSRRYDDAIRQYRAALELDPNFAQAHLWFGRPYLETGRYADAIAEVETAVRLSHDSTMSLSVLGHVYASAGRPRKAREILRRLRDRGRESYVPSYWIALIHTGLGERDSAFAWLRRAEREGSAWLAWVGVEPRFDLLRSDPRFSRLLRRLRLA